MLIAKLRSKDWFISVRPACLPVWRICEAHSRAAKKLKDFALSNTTLPWTGKHRSLRKVLKRAQSGDRNDSSEAERDEFFLGAGRQS